MSRNQNGFTALEIVLSVVLLAGIGTVSYFAYQASQHKSDSSVTVATPTVASSSTPAPSATPAAAESFLTIKEFGVKFLLNDEFKDLRYSYSNQNGVALLGFTTGSLLAADPTCTASNAPLAGISVLNSRTDNDGTYLGSVNNRHFYYFHPQYACGNSDEARALAVKQVNNILPTLKTITAE